MILWNSYGIDGTPIEKLPPEMVIFNSYFSLPEGMA
jgi:hypothetical protein